MVRTGQQLPLLQLMENFVAGKHSLFPIPQSFDSNKWVVYTKSWLLIHKTVK
jgi:hypothetical protein